MEMEHTIRIRVDDAVYNLSTYEETSNILVYMDGFSVRKHNNSHSDSVLYPNEQCCVFSHLTDLLAYISLTKHDDAVCEGIGCADYIVIKPCRNYSLTYELLKRYKDVYGFMRVNDENRAVNSVLAELLGCSFVNEDYRFQEHEALVAYCMNKYRALEL